MMKNGFGGLSGGAVSEPETLPFVPEGLVDLKHRTAGVEAGRLGHGMGKARGGTYHCLADGCPYYSRSKSNMKRHATAKNRQHGMGSSPSDASSSSMGSSSGMSSTSGLPSSGSMG